MKKKFLILVLALVMTLIFVPSIASAENITEFAGGSGTEAEPYLISTTAQLNNVRKYLDAHFKLTCDIEFTEEDFAEDGAFYNNGAGWQPIGTRSSPFTGSFDGNGFAVKNLYVNISSEFDVIYVGLFGCNEGTIKNLGIVDGTISATTAEGGAVAGGIAGYTKGTIENCYNTGTVSATSATAEMCYACAGGIAGSNYGTVKHSYNTGTVSVVGRNHSDEVPTGVDAGGIAGSNNAGTIENCYNTGNVLAEGDCDAGGIAGENDSGTIENCYNTGAISAYSVYAYAGGIAGFNSGTITGCYNIGTISSNNYVGGIVGRNYKGIIENCYNTGTVSAIVTNYHFEAVAYAGGIAGENGSGTIKNCYNTGTVSATAEVRNPGDIYEPGSVACAGGIVGDNTGTIENSYNIGDVSVTATDYAYAGGIVGRDYKGTIKNCYYLDATPAGVGDGIDTATKCTAEEMLLQSTFVGFDFDTVWVINAGSEYKYPVLINETTTHDYITTITQATASENGSIVETCSVCGDVRSTTIHYAETFTLSDTKYAYDGSIKTPTVTVIDAAGTALIQDTDYIVTYENDCVTVGTYTVTVEGIGNYAFTQTLTFEIDFCDISACLAELSATSYTYDGLEKTPTLAITNSAGITLTQDTDYTVTYDSDRINVGTYAVTITGMGNYIGTQVLTFRIDPIQMADCPMSLSDTSYTYNAEVRTPTVTVTDPSGNNLIEGTHYTVAYASGRVNAGTYTVTVTGMGHYAGTQVLSFQIDPIQIADYPMSLSATSYTYNTKVRTPTVTVTDPSGNNFTEGTHYTVTYASGRVNVGTYTVTVTGMGNYAGTKTLSFKINPIDISKCAVKLSATNYTFNGTVRTPTVTIVSTTGYTLTKGVSYTVSYASGRKNVGTYTVTVNMMGNYTGTKTLSFKINPVKISYCTMSLAATNYTFNGNVKTPSVTVISPGGSTLTKGVSYTVSYASGRKNVGTYTVTVNMMGNYTGTKTLSFKINPVKVSYCTMSLSTTNYAYNGSVKTPTVTVKSPGGSTLTKGVSYTVSYASGRKNVGTYTATVTMMGNYTGTKTLTFYVKPTTKTKVSMIVDGTFDIGANGDKAITYTSSNSAVAEVSSTGVITAVTAGTAKITVRSGTTVQAITVTVETPYIAVNETNTLLLGKSVMLKATTNTGSTVQWSSADSSIATVSSSGTVTGKKAGMTTIYATVTYQGQTYTGRYIVTVQPPYLSENSATIDRGNTHQISVVGGTGTASYSSSDTSVASVSSSGVVKGLAAGSTTITVEQNGYFLMFTIRVEVREIKVGALCYHKFYTQEEADKGVSFSTYAVWADEFEQHLQYLAEQNIQVITVSELTDFVEGKIDLPEKCMLLTLDDCDISFYKYAYPLLKKYDVKINAAVIGNRTDGAQEGNAYRASYSTWDEIAEMAASGYVEFGAHTYYLHDTNEGRTGTMLKSDEGLGTYRRVLTNDLTPLNAKIKSYVGYTPSFFVYPYYAVSMPSIPTLRDTLGYKFLFCGNSDSAFRYMGESIHASNYNPFTKGGEPESCLIKRYTPRSGDNIATIVETIFSEP